MNSIILCIALTGPPDLSGGPFDVPLSEYGHHRTLETSQEQLARRHLQRVAARKAVDRRARLRRKRALRAGQSYVGHRRYGYYRQTRNYRNYRYYQNYRRSRYYCQGRVIRVPHAYGSVRYFVP